MDIRPEGSGWKLAVAQAASETTHAATLLLAPDGVILDINRPMAEALGKPREVLKGTRVWSWLPPESHAHRQNLLRRVLEHGSPLRHDTEHNGRWFDSTVTPCRNDRGEVTGVMIEAWDITERKRAERAQRESQEGFRILFDQASDGMLLVDPETKRLILANRQIQSWLGYSETQLLQLTAVDLHPSADRTAIDEFFDKILSGEVALIPSAPVRHKDGTIFYADISAAPLHWQQRRCILGIFRDVTARIKAEQIRQESTELLSLFISHSPIYAFMKEVTPTDSRFLMASENFRDAFGLPASKIIGLTTRQLCPGELGEKLTSDDWAVVSSGRVLKLDEVVNGRSYTVIKFPIKHGDKTLLAGYSIDITEHKQAEREREQLEAQNRQLQKSESLGRMAGAIAHHFNNQLQAVMGNLELAMIDLPQDCGQRELLAEAMDAARKAAELSSLMQAYVGRTNARQEPLDLSGACRRSLSMLRPLLPGSAALETHLPLPGPMVKANADQVHQVLTNLLTNAFEASVDGKGPIRLTVKTALAEDILKAHHFPPDWQSKAATYACLEVTDTGCGIPAENLEEVFDPFFSTKFLGRGLGLPVALGIVRAHGGVITVESRPGCGSTFRVFWPLSTEAIPHRPEPVPLDQLHGEDKQGAVLLVEDDPVVKKVTTLALRRLGFAVLLAADGIEAVEVFRQHRAEVICVISDLAMPRMNGWKTLAVLRQLSPGIPFILCSAYSEAHAMAGYHPEQPQAFLSKPFTIETLSNTLAQVMAARKP